MTYQICKRCSKMFEKNGKIYCKDCFEKNEREYDLIINHIKKHPNATVLDIITETSVSLKSINCFVEEGGIVYVENKPKVEDNDEKPKMSDRTLMKRSKFHLTR